MKKKTLTILIIIDALLLIAAVFADLLLIYAGIYSDHFTVYGYIILAFQGLVALLAIYYILTGCKKGKGTAYYKWYMIAFAVLFLISQLRADVMNLAGIIIVTVCFGALCVLCFGKDLGKKLSALLAIIVTVLSALLLVTSAASGDVSNMTVLIIVTKIVLGLTTLLMVAAKYDDKASRGSK